MLDLAHVHPMLVHFPIVLWLLAIALQFVLLIRGGHFADQSAWATTAFWILFLGTVGGIVAATFGDMALDIAVKKGFPQAPIETHEELALTTLWLFIALTVVHAVLLWKRITLNRGLAWLLFLVAVAGGILLVTAAYFGGHLVYDLGVNVAPVHP